MQNYEQILTELGIEVPEDKKADLKKKMGDNYKTISDYENVKAKRDEYKSSLDDVQERLKGFDGINVKDLETQIDKLNADLDAERKARAHDAAVIEQEKTINALFDSVGDDGKKLYPFMNDITRDHYRAALLEELDKDSAKGKSAADIFKKMITDTDGKTKDGIFENVAEQSRARFTTPTPNSSSHGSMTKDDIMNIKDATERQAAIAENAHLFSH